MSDVKINTTLDVENKIIENSILQLYDKFIIEFSSCNNNKQIIEFYGNSRQVKDETFEIIKELNEFIVIAEKKQVYSEEEHKTLFKRILNFKVMCQKKAPEILINSKRSITFSIDTPNDIYISELTKLKSSIYIIGQSTLINIYVKMIEYKELINISK